MIHASSCWRPAGLVLMGLLSAGCHHGSTAADGGPSDACSLGAPLPLAYLANTPPLQPVRVVDVTGETHARMLLARTLQGIVNRTAVRIYLSDDVDSENGASMLGVESHQHWLSEFQQQHLITVAATGKLDDALKAFASEIKGYLLVSEAEPWGIEAATTEAGPRAAVVATADTAPGLEGMGFQQLDNLVGRWATASACYADQTKKVGTLGFPGMAIMSSHDHQPRDFLIQQGVVSVAGYPFTPDWADVQAALAKVPPGVPLYGYPARTGEEELQAVTEFSAAGDILIASDSTPNLSFYQAVHPSRLTRPPVVDTSVDCASAELNVVVGLSDGDNLVVPISRYPTSKYWLSPDRGRIPLAWSISGGLAAIAPAVFDYYARTIAPNDELVMMIGAGYAYGSQMPNSDWFYGESFQEMQAQGVRVLWLFDPTEQGSGYYTWQARGAQALGCGSLAGLLDGYYPALIYPDAPASEVVGSVPIIRATGGYADHPQQIADRIRAALALPRAQRPPVVFFSAAIWSNDVPTLVAALTPLEAQGVRFLSASAGVKCVRR
jgi:hypothetical protein